ncbi:MAG: hypothetical protein K0R67_391 [Paenibacillus sp.]|jgi:hypothetical protein|nr:hypothetical protein [Paenibacillus sp.]
MGHLETKEVLEAELRGIIEWERKQKDIWFWEKLGRLPFLLLDRITPKFVQEKLGVALNEMGSYVQSGGRYLISERSILDKLEEQAGLSSDSLTIDKAGQLPLEVMDRVADDLTGTRSKMAAVQGATTGFGGIFTLAIDIPALLGLSLKVLQEIAVCYGYDPKEKRERVFVVKCLQFASSDIVGKRAVLEELAEFTEERGQNQVISQLQGWREVVTSYRDNFGWKKLFQLVPIAGMIFGAFINKGTLQDVAEAGKMLYRKRRIVERLTELEQ